MTEGVWGACGGWLRGIGVMWLYGSLGVVKETIKLLID